MLTLHFIGTHNQLCRIRALGLAVGVDEILLHGFCGRVNCQPLNRVGFKHRFALGAFLLYLTLALKTPVYSLVGGLFFATTVLVTRTIFLCVDKGWKCPYTKLAIPAESAFVIALWICYILSKTLY